jgi:hypothetical protein
VLLELVELELDVLELDVLEELVLDVDELDVELLELLYVPIVLELLDVFLSAHMTTVQEGTGATPLSATHPVEGGKYVEAVE